MAPRVLYVSADCHCSGVEVKGAKGKLVMTKPAELGLSPELYRDIQLWQHWFDGVFDHCPAKERYAALGNRFDDECRRLAKRVTRELGAGWQVWYEPRGSWRVGGHRAVTAIPVCVAEDEDGS